MQGKEVTISLEMLGGKSTDSRGLKHYAGVTLGRVAGRLRNTFQANGKTYEIAKNDGPNHIFGGLKGWDHYNWSSQIVDSIKLSQMVELTDNQEDTQFKGVTFKRTSQDMEEGFPGALDIQSSIFVSECNKLAFFY